MSNAAPAAADGNGGTTLTLSPKETAMNMPYQGTGTPITGKALQTMQQRIGCDPATLWAILTVETHGFGYLNDRRPKILFERHIFHKLTNGRYDAYPDLSAPTPGGYIGGAAEYARLQRALALDHDAALSSASWGLGQIMGYHASRLKYADIDAMVDAFVDSEDAQLDGMCRFIETTPQLRDAMRHEDWETIARYYNGSDYARMGYHEKLRCAHDEFAHANAPDVNVRAAQVYLTYLGFDPKGIDGCRGRNTLAALHAFQQKAGLAQDDVIDDATVATLQAAFRRSQQ